MKSLLLYPNSYKTCIIKDGGIFYDYIYPPTYLVIQIPIVLGLSKVKRSLYSYISRP